MARVVVRDRDGNIALIGRNQYGIAEPVFSGSDSNVIEMDEHRPYSVGYAHCRCGHSKLVSVDLRANPEKLQCNACGCMTARLLRDPPPATVAR